MKDDQKMLSVVLPKDLYMKIKERAFLDDKSVSEEVRILLDQLMKHLEKKGNKK